jgi:hypothetical protein
MPTREYPGDPDEINILAIKNRNGSPVPVPECEDDGGNGDYEKLCDELIKNLYEEEAKAMETIAIEPWD